MNSSLDFSQFEVLTFDCYGTLIDWESGILGALQPLMRQHGISVDDERLLEAYARAESKAESGEFITYKHVLEQVVRQLGAEMGFVPGPVEQQALWRSLKSWRPFPDTVDALERLHRRFKLAIISNIDDDLFADTAKLLSVPFDWVTTALEVRSYKPSLNNFQRALAKMNISKDKVLHVAQSLHHDVEPAHALGIRAVWVNRRHNKKGGGATVLSKEKPDLEVPDLKTLTALSV
jgi:2-haloacid dehalogenase